MTLLDFNELPVGSQISLPLSDRGTLLYGTAVPNSGSSTSMLLTDVNVRYVDKGGNDTTGDGSRVAPFLTVQKAITVCAALATQSNPFAVRVSPGTYATTFKLAANVYVVGSGSGSGSYNGTPQTGLTIIAPNFTNTLDASFAGAAVRATGIISCALSNPAKFDFATIASTAPSTILIDDVQTDLGVTFIGSGNAEYATVRSLYINSTSLLTFQNMGGALLQGCGNDFAGGLVLLQSAALQSFYEIMGSFFQDLTVTWTSALITNFMIVTCTGRISMTQPLITGAGATVIADQSTDIIMPAGADARLSFGNNALGTIIGLNHGYNIIQCTPSADRTLTIDRPAVPGGVTTILLVNQNGNGPVLNFALQSGGIANGGGSYVPPASSVLIVFDARGGGATHWFVLPYTQFGQVQLTNGVSAFIPCDLDANSTITATLKTFSGAAGVISAKGADRVNGTRLAGGGFKLTSILLATGATVATDAGTYDWHVVGLGAGT